MLGQAQRRYRNHEILTEYNLDFKQSKKIKMSKFLHIYDLLKHFRINFVSLYLKVLQTQKCEKVAKQAGAELGQAQV